MSQEDDQNYPGPEDFWRQSPELTNLQDRIEKLWIKLDYLPLIPEHKINSLEVGNTITVKQFTSHGPRYEIFMLGSKPRKTSYQGNPWHVLPKSATSKADKFVPFKIYLEKWPSGYLIDGDPIIQGVNWSVYIPQGEEAFKSVRADIHNEALRLFALRYLLKNRRETNRVRKEENQRVLRMAINYLDRIDK